MLIVAAAAVATLRQAQNVGAQQFNSDVDSQTTYTGDYLQWWRLVWN